MLFDCPLRNVKNKSINERCFVGKHINDTMATHYRYDPKACFLICMANEEKWLVEGVINNELIE